MKKEDIRVLAVIDGIKEEPYLILKTPGAACVIGAREYKRIWGQYHPEHLERVHSLDQRRQANMSRYLAILEVNDEVLQETEEGSLTNALEWCSDSGVHLEDYAPISGDYRGVECRLKDVIK